LRNAARDLKYGAVMRRLAVFLLSGWAMGCSFDGVSGTSIDGGLVPDGATDAAGGVEPPAPATRCTGFVAIAGSHYQLSTQTRSWSAAQAACATETWKHLATFETLAEIQAVVSGVPLTAEVWTGVIQKRPANRSSMNWINAGELAPLPASFPWDGGEPNDGGGIFPSENGSEDTAELRPNARFNDERNDRLNLALCECEEVTRDRSSDD
jgi:Lectin C-type domain